VSFIVQGRRIHLGDISAESHLDDAALIIPISMPNVILIAKIGDSLSRPYGRPDWSQRDPIVSTVSSLGFGVGSWCHKLVTLTNKD
jgi:hypothetical protein